MKQLDCKVINIIGITGIIVRWIVRPWGENNPMKKADCKLISMILMSEILTLLWLDH